MVIDPNNKGYMFNGRYIECISQHCWNLYLLWTRDKSQHNRNEMIKLFSHIKRTQKNNWSIFITNPIMPIVPFKKDYFLILSEIAPQEKCIGYHFNGTIIYETYAKRQN